MELPSRGAILQVPRECHVVSTWRWTRQDVRRVAHIIVILKLTPFLNVCDIFLAVLNLITSLNLVGIEMRWFCRLSGLERLRPRT